MSLADAAQQGPIRVGQHAPSRGAMRVARRQERRLLRASMPVAWTLLHRVFRNRRETWRLPGVGYLITGAEACREAILDQELFSKDGDRSAGVLMTQVMGPTALLNMDGDSHLALRRRLQDVFTPKFVDDLCETSLTGVLGGAAEQLQHGQPVDVARLARIVSGTMMCDVIGLDVPAERREQRALELFALAQQLIRLVPVRIRPLDPATLARAKQAYQQLVAGVDEVYATGADTTVPGRMRALGLTLEEARGVVGILLIAGTETTSSAVARIVALLHDTKQWTRLQQDRTLLTGAIDEGLRFCTPVPVSTRTTMQDRSFRGRRLKADKLALIAWSRAMRDPAVIARGEDFDIGRSIPSELRRLWFGAGPHYCIGFNLAQKEITIVLKTLLDAAPELDVLERAPARGALLPAWERLVVARRLPRAARA